MRLVLIDWLDSYGCSSEWQPVDEVKATALRCKSVGWLIQDAEDCKVIIPHLSESDHSHAKQQGCGDMTIPSQAILSIKDLPSE